jgi:hypothetical protein
MTRTSSILDVAAGQVRAGDANVTIRVARQAGDGRFEVEYPPGRTATSVLSAATILQLYPRVVAVTPRPGWPR